MRRSWRRARRPRRRRRRPRRRCRWCRAWRARSSWRRRPASWPATPGGAVGRLGGVRVEGVAEEGATPLHARADDVLQLRGRRAGCWRTSTRDEAGPQVRGQPAAIREAAGATAPRAPPRSIRSRSRAHPVSAEARGPRGERASGSASPGTRRSTISPAASAARSRRASNKVMYHVGRPGEDGYMERVLAGVGRRWPQQPHEHLLVRRARGLRRSGWGSDRPSPRLRQRPVHPAHLGRTWRAATTSIRTPSGSSRRR